MGDTKGFLKVKRKAAKYRSASERIRDFKEISALPKTAHSQDQASRCMDCGTPFCHWACPIGNYIPEWNDAVFNGRWNKAFQLLSVTNNLPEITGRICPALCEYSCVLGINDDPVTIRENELVVIEHAFNSGLIKPQSPSRRNGKRIAIVGSGPAGLACADQLNKAGYLVVVFEKADRIGGILRYGIPDFKLEKWILDRRIELLKREGIIFNASTHIGKHLKGDYLREEFDAACLAAGSGVPRDLKIEGRNLKGIYFAMDYLTQSNRRVAGEEIDAEELIDAKGKKVVVIGGGDTGADCIGVAHRQKADCITQIEILPQPSQCRTEECPWPKYPVLLKTSTSHEEGGVRQWAVSTKRFIGEDGFVKRLSCVKVDIGRDSKGCFCIKEIPGSEFGIEADLVILALGFMHPEKHGIIEELDLKLDSRSLIETTHNFMTSQKGIFACGDMHRGQSLIVWAIAEGRQAAYNIDTYLSGRSYLPMI